MNNEKEFEDHGADVATSEAKPVEEVSEKKEKKEKKELPWLLETLLIILCVLCVVGLVQTFIGRQYVIPSGSMEPTLHGCDGCTNDRIFTCLLYTSPSPRD